MLATRSCQWSFTTWCCGNKDGRCNSRCCRTVFPEIHQRMSGCATWLCISCCMKTSSLHCVVEHPSFRIVWFTIRVALLFSTLEFGDLTSESHLYSLVLPSRMAWFNSQVAPFDMNVIAVVSCKDKPFCSQVLPLFQLPIFEFTN